MQAATVLEFSYSVHGRTRDECIALADRVAEEMLQAIGGVPWTMLDDDWQRRNVIQDPGRPVTVADHLGFYYIGRRRYQFDGPYLGNQDVTLHEGFSLQHHVGE